MTKIIDCITFFDNNFMFDLRYNVLKNYVDYFVVCESKFDHRGNPKKINFIKKDEYDFTKIKYFLLEEAFPKNTNIWENQAIQREFLLESTNFAEPEDYIFFSDPDEIPNPEILINFELKKKYGIFMQKCFNYKFNLFNSYESPWEGPRVSKKKNLKSINFMRQKIKSKNLNYNFLRIDKEKNIQIFNDGGWHFNNILDPQEISLKLKTFAHSEFSSEEFSSPNVIKEKIEKKIDLFNRGHNYKKIEINETFPKYFLNNLEKYKKFII
jgi:beta-1,4-mannosyl-glycoprotein beta-1,4-N-acetylglucosaminyltransferase|tara:strand:+ start:500 stop:1303 length:804 start_codon:yes stop_codon:yes gene_type:complete